MPKLKIFFPYVTFTFSLILVVSHFLQLGFHYNPLLYFDVKGALLFHFTHANNSHLIMNLTAIIPFGCLIEFLEGHWKTLKTYITLLLLLSLLVLFSGWIFYFRPVIGASGFAYSLMGYVYLILLEYLKIGNLVPKKGAMKEFFYAIAAILVTILITASVLDQILASIFITNSHVAFEIHIMGFLVGFAYRVFERLDDSQTPEED